MKRRPLLMIPLFIGLLGFGPCNVMELDADKSTGSETDSASGSGDTDSVTCDELDVTCNHSLDIEVLLAKAEAFESGAYGFSVTAPDESVYRIDCYLPFVAGELLCEQGQVDDLQAALDPDDPSVFNFHINGAPEYLLVEVFYNNALIGTETLVPAYDRSYPNGAGCEPVCYNGRDQIAVSVR